MSASTPTDPPAAGQPPPTTNLVPPTDDGVRTLPADVRPLPAAEAPPAAGRFRVLRPHARGGLGEVFVARDEELNRDVALKRIRPQHAHQLTSRRRFLTEAELTARLEHPGVVPVHGLVRDADGQPCYAMRFIAGATLADAIGRFHAPGSPEDSRGLEFRQLLQRFVQVCNTIAYAHSRGVVHRDLKPANVMLGPFGETLVVDWGLAKEIGVRNQGSGVSEDRAAASLTPDPCLLTPAASADQTEAGELLGTPRYMAPEQAAGVHAAVGPASDVYGLGGILYAILTGRDPYTDPDPYRVLERVRSGELDPPRRVRPTVPPALEAVCLKAMAFRPQDRYPSALALAADVERWLADEPVGVHRELWPDRVRRWGRRHRALVAASVALLVTALAGLTATVVLVSRQQAVTAAEKKRAEEQRDRADGFYKLSRAALDTTVKQITIHPKLSTGDFHDLRATLLAEMIPFYEALARQKGDDPATEAERGRAFGYLGSLRSTMGQTDEAERAFRRMVAVFTRLAEQHPDEPEYRRRLATGHSDLGSLLRDTGRPQDGLGELRDGVQMKQALADAQPNDTELHQELAAGLINLGMALQEVGQSSEAEATFTRSLGLYRPLADARPDDPLLASRCAATENNLAALLKSLGRPAEAEPLYRSAIDRRAKLVKAFPAEPEYRQDLAAGYFNLGNLLMQTDHKPDAERSYQSALALLERLAADFPRIPAYRRELAKGLTNLGVTLEKSGRSADAVPPLRRAVALHGRLVADFPGLPVHRKEFGESLFNLALALQVVDQHAEAETVLRQSAEQYERLAADAPGAAEPAVELASVWVALGDLCRTAPSGAPATALAWYDRAVARLESAPAAGTPSARRVLCDAQTNRALSLLSASRYIEAAAALEQAADRADEAGRPSLRLRQAQVLALAGDHRRAAAVARELTTGREPSGEVLDTLARVLAQASAKAKDDAPAADDYARQSVALLRRAHAAGQYRSVGAAEQLRQDAIFASLRDRDDFAAFLRELEKKK